MLLTITTSHQPATDLGYLLHKHPDKLHSRALAAGTAYLFYPEATDEKSTAAILLDMDPVALVRGRTGSRDGGLFDHYVTDRPYAVSSIMSTAISRLLSTAMSGRSKGRQELADTALPFTVTMTPLPVRGGIEILERIFTPLGYTVETEPHALDETHPEWGASPYMTVTLTNKVRLAELLTHLFVLIPVMDNQKHYWVGRDEVEKLLSKGDGWLEHHPEQRMIAKRYLRHSSGYTRAVMEALAERVEPEPEEIAEAAEQAEEVLEKPIRLHDQRLQAVTAALKDTGAKSVVDLGCGEGRLLSHLMKEKQFERILGVEVSNRSLERAERKLRIGRLTPRQAERIDLVQGALTYRDARVAGFDAAAMVEVIEHVDEGRLPALERAIFHHARPGTVVVTTPNREFNQTFEGMEPGKLRHPDHRFEWTRAEFETWANGVAERNGYAVTFAPIGEEHTEFGPPSQMGVFKR